MGTRCPSCRADRRAAAEGTDRSSGRRQSRRSARGRRNRPGRCTARACRADSRAARLRAAGCRWPVVSVGCRCAAAPACACPLTGPPSVISPDVCVKRSRTVMSRFAFTISTSTGGPPRPPRPPRPWPPGPAPDAGAGGAAGAPAGGTAGGLATATFADLNSGMNRETGSFSRIFPSSTSIITATAVMGFDIDASLNTPSFGIGFCVSTFSSPCASKCAMRPLRATRVTTPGSAPASR